MSVRKNIVALGVATAAIAGTALTAMAPANADDPTPWYTKANSGVAAGSTLASGSIIGAGSDTIQFVDGALAEAYNASKGLTAGTSAGAVVSLAACLQPGADGSTAVDTLYACPTSNADQSPPVFPFTFPAGTTGAFAANKVNLATSSGSGADLLANSKSGGADQVPGLAFSRASGIKNSQYLDAYPFALDEVVMVTSGNVASNAPATLTRAEIAGIYDGNYTNWDQLGGKNAPIHAYAIGNGGSGTLQAFYDQLTAEDPATYPSRQGGNVDTSLFAIGNPANPAGSFVSTIGESGTGGKAGAAAGKTIIEHDPTAIENDPDAIAAFSYSRVVTDNGAIKPVGGWVLDRAVFNEIRDGSKETAANLAGVDPNWIIGGSGTADQPGGLVHDLFGPTGYFCSADARQIMQDNGFFQLKSSCGQAQTTSSYTGTLDAYGAPSQSKTTATVAGKAVTVTVASADSANTAVPSGNVSVAFIPKNVPGAKSAVPAPVTGTLSNGTVTVTAPSTLAAGTYQVAVSYVGNGNTEGDFQGSWVDPQGLVTVAGSVTTKPGGGTTTKPAPVTTPVNTKLVNAEKKLTKDEKALKKAKKQAKKAHGAKKAKLAKKIKKLKKAIKADKSAVQAAK